MSLKKQLISLLYLLQKNKAMLPLFISDVPLHCINEAAIEYHVPAKLIISILNIERGKIGQAILNSNGTYDLGPFQVNSRWLPELRRYGYTPEAIQYNACINVRVAAWILAKSIVSQKNFLPGVGAYHSHTLKHNLSYLEKVKVNFTKLDVFLKNET